MGNKFSGMLGMLEMEQAVERIYELGPHQPISIEQMQSQTERIGFCELIYRGWLSKITEEYHPLYNGYFIVNSGLMTRITDRLYCTGANI